MTKHKHNLYLIGPMGSGKSTTGKALAKLTGLTFYDADEVIEQQTGVEISWIFEREGESGFRSREQACIAELTKKQNIVLATGGGVVTQKANRQALQSTGIVIYLEVSLDQQFKRIASKSSTRPMLATFKTKEQLKELNQSRAHLYQSIADVTYNTNNSTPQTIAEKIFSDYPSLLDQPGKRL